MPKRCFKCGLELPLSEFYRHPRMADGRINKCKVCARKDTRERYGATRDARHAYERERSKRPERKAYKSDAARDYRERERAKYVARYTLGNAIRDGRIKRMPCEVCGGFAEGHHEDYSRPLDVRWLCFAHHRAEHGQVAG